MESSKIQWTSHTFNPWRGCSRVSEGCRNCYAEAMSARNPGVLGVWGKEGTRAIAAESYWRGPLRWNADALAAGERRRVFCASLADVFEGQDTMPEAAWGVVEAARWRLFTLIAETPALDWLLLTKRPENVRSALARMRLGGVLSMEHWPWENVWLGASVEDQACANERIPHLLEAPARVRFLSMEPLLGAVDLWPWLGRALGNMDEARIDWVIIGGESGTGARGFDLDAAEQIIGQCREAGVPVFVKQFGRVPLGLDYYLRDRKGGDWDEWPELFRVREFPASA